MTLVLQAILPYLLLAPPDDFDSGVTTTVLTLIGGTHVSTSPTVSYTDQVFCHNLGQIFPYDPPLIRVSEEHKFKMGWVAGRHTSGEVSFLIRHVEHGTTLPAFEVPSRGPVQRILITILAPDEGRALLRTRVMMAVADGFPEVPEVEILIDEESGNRHRYYLLLVAETWDGYRLGRDQLFPSSVGEGRRGQTRKEDVVEIIVQRCLAQLSQELETGLAFDGRMIDQIAVFAGLAEGRSTFSESQNTHDLTIDGPDPRSSMHAITARWVTESLVGAAFERDGTCQGVGFVSGEQNWQPHQGKSKQEILEKYKKFELPKDDEDEEVAEHLKNLHIQGRMPAW